MKRTSIFLVVVALATAALIAQAPATSGVVALTGARIIDGTGRAPVQQASRYPPVWFAPIAPRTDAGNLTRTTRFRSLTT